MLHRTSTQTVLRVLMKEIIQMIVKMSLRLSMITLVKTWAEMDARAGTKGVWRASSRQRISLPD